MNTQSVDKIQVTCGNISGYIIGTNFYQLLEVVKSLPGATFDYSKKVWFIASGTDIQKKLDSKKKITGLRFVDESGLNSAIAEKRQAEFAQQAKLDRERQERYEREREQARIQLEAERKAQQIAIASRVKVRASQYKVGDIINGKAIVNFGQSWVETESGNWGSRGTRYDEACEHCHNITEVDNETGLCSKCGADGQRVNVCYAYFS